MSEKMIACKACGQEIAKSAKNCPHCGAKNKKGNPIVTGIIVIVALIIIIAATSGDKEPTRVDNNGTSTNQETVAEAEKKEETNRFHVGETAKLNDVLVALVGVTENTGSSFNTPAEGNVFVLCEFDIDNQSNEEINISSMLSFEAYCDDYACGYSLGALIEKDNKNQLDGAVAAGKKFNGVVGYEVPEDWEELEVHFTPDFFAGKDIVFVATNQ